MIRPGQLNLMTAGRGIAHAEESPAEQDPQLHGVQLWVALPEATRQVGPRSSIMPSCRRPDGRVHDHRVHGRAGRGPLAGDRVLPDRRAPSWRAAQAGPGELPLDPAFEHVIFVVAGAAEAAAAAGPGQAAVPGAGREQASLAAAGGQHAAAARRGAARRAAADVVELRRPGPPRRSSRRPGTGRRAPGSARCTGITGGRCPPRRWTGCPAPALSPHAPGLVAESSGTGDVGREAAVHDGTRG